MIVPGSSSPLLLSPTNYNLTRSLRFRSSASAYLNRTPATTTNRKTFTYSLWLKRGILSSSSSYALMNCGTATIGQVVSQFYITSDKLSFETSTYGVTNYIVGTTSAVFRDPSAWYHIVFSIDTTQVTNSNGVRIYVNGVQQTLTFSAYTQNYDTAINTNALHDIGQNRLATNYFDGYLTEVNFIDGQALTPSSFGQTSSTTGVWQPKKYTGTYGTNGFYLPFTDNSALTSGSNAGLGKDFSGNGNYWNTNNISITSGSTYDSMTDVPTLTSATASNFCTLNPIFDPNYLASTNQSNVTMSGGNLNYGTGGRNGFGTIAPSSGKYYWEMSNTSNTSASVVVTGVVTIDARSSIYGVYYNSSNGNKGQGFLASGATETSYGSTWTDNDIIGVALDCDTNTVTFYKNNVSQGAITNSNLAGKQIVAWMQSGNNVNSMTGWFNFGQRPFAYTPPTGFVALNTFNLPTPTIGATASSQAGKYFNPILYTGNGSNPRSLTGVGFQPDMVWFKTRSEAGANSVYDAVRGAGSTKLLVTNSTGQEGYDPPYQSADYGYISSFNSDGYSVAAGNVSGDWVNKNNATYVAWCWKANGSGSSNTDGSITSTVSANTTSGFSVVTFSTNASSGGATIGHGLGVAPKMIIMKARNQTYSWDVYHASLGANYRMILNSNAAISASSTDYWNGTSPTSSVFSINQAFYGTGVNTVAYCFAEVAGFSKFGSYTGNGSNDGPFIYTGFRPRYILLKETNGANDQWVVRDTARDPYNASTTSLYPNLSNADDTISNGQIDIVSNGFKIMGAAVQANQNGIIYIYACFAENPFKYSLAR